MLEEKISSKHKMEAGRNPALSNNFRSYIDSISKQHQCLPFDADSPFKLDETSVKF